MSPELETEIRRYLNRVWMGGYIELSQEKVRGEYQYYKKRAGELLADWREEDETG